MKTIFHNTKSPHPEVKAAVLHLVLLVLALGAEFVNHSSCSFINLFHNLLLS